MHPRKRNSHSIRTIVALLLTIGVLAMLLPQRWTRGLIGLVQFTVPFQDAVSATTDRVVPSFGSSTPTPEAQRIKALEHTIAVLASQIRSLEEETDLLRGTRLWTANGRSFGAWGKLLPARVISQDILPWRSSRLLNVGTVQGVGRNAPVVSREFSLDAGETDGLYPGMAILLRETLIGFVEDVSTHTAQVKLMSDVTTQRAVVIGRIDGEFNVSVLPDPFWLTGKGHGRMVIEGVKRSYINRDEIAVGDIVLTPDDEPDLPTSMCIGEIIEIEPDRKNPLLVTLHVIARIDEQALSRVYVFDPDDIND